MPVSEQQIEVDVVANGGIQIVKTDPHNRTRLCTLRYEEALQLYRALRVAFPKMQDEQLKNIESCIKEVGKQISNKKDEFQKLEDRHRELIAERSNILREEP